MILGWTIVGVSVLALAAALAIVMEHERDLS